jgi:putative transposase
MLLLRRSRAHCILVTRAVGLPWLFCTSCNDRNWTEKELFMARKRHTAEQVVNLLRQVEVAIANGKTTGQACKEALITEQTYYRWRKEYGGLQVDQAKRLKELEQENSKLKRLVANLSLERLVLKDIAEGNF